MNSDKRDIVFGEGEPPAKFRVYTTDVNDQPFECVAEYDTLQEARAHRWRADKRYKIWVSRKYMSLPEFLAWAEAEK